MIREIFKKINSEKQNLKDQKKAGKSAFEADQGFKAHV